MKILSINQKILIFLGLCTPNEKISALQHFRYAITPLIIIIFYTYVFAGPSARYVIENLGDYYEYNWAVYQFVASLQIFCVIISVAINKAKVREIYNELQEIINKSE